VSKGEESVSAGRLSRASGERESRPLTPGPVLLGEERSLEESESSESKEGDQRVSTNKGSNVSRSNARQSKGKKEKPDAKGRGCPRRTDKKTSTGTGASQIVGVSRTPRGGAETTA